MRIPVSGITSLERLAEQGTKLAEITTALTEGELCEYAPGFFYTPDAVTELHDFAEVAAMVPLGVFCLYSALFLHDLTDQAPHELWIAVPPGCPRPKIPMFPVRFFEFAGANYVDGVLSRQAESIEIKLYSIPKTISDLFATGGHFGETIATEALSEALNDEKTTVEEVLAFAAKQGVTDLVRSRLAMR